MLRLLLCFFVLFMFSLSGYGQDNSLYQKKWMVQGADTMPYRLLLPENFDALKSYPVIFVLHGAGERGNDNENQLTHGAAFFLNNANRKKFPAIVIFPQCSPSGYWSNVLRLHGDSIHRSFYFLKDGAPTRDMALLIRLVDYILETLPVNAKQVYVGGLSMGGMGTFEIVRRSPGLFAAAFSICGGANPATAKYLSATKWWIFHGAKDDIVDPVFSEKMAAALKRINSATRFTLYPEANHNSWDAAFAEPDLLPWLFSQHK